MDSTDKKEQGSSEKNWTFPRDTKVLAIMRDEISAFSKKSEIPEASINKIILCLDEAAANIIEHSEGPIDFEIKAVVADNQLEVTISDNGNPYDPTQKPDVDLKSHIRSGSKDGLGLFIMKKLLDVFEYRYESGRNVCTLGVRVA